MNDPESSAATFVERFQMLGLTGKIISVVPRLPCAVGLHSDRDLAIAPLPNKAALEGVLGHFADAGWKSAVVGWVGEVLPATSAAFQQLLMLADSTTDTVDIFDQLGDVTLSGADPPDYQSNLARRLESFDCVGIEEEHRRQLSKILEQHLQQQVIPVWLGEWNGQQDAPILVGANKAADYAATTSAMLYQTLHDVPPTVGDTDNAEKFLDAYEHMNRCVAEAIIKIYQPGDVIWIHTHQHMLLPEILRKKVPACTIIYNQLEPWPSQQVMPTLLHDRKLITSLLECDTVCVPNLEVYKSLNEYYEQSVSMPEYMLREMAVHAPRIRISPPNMAVQGLRDFLQGSFVNDQVQLFKKTFVGKKIIAAKARMDQLVGVMVVLDAFRHLLSTYPLWIKHVVLVLLVTPDRLPEYALYAGEISEIEVNKYINEINSQFGSLTYQPIVYFSGYRPQSEYLALLKIANVGVVVHNQKPANDMIREFVIAHEETHNPVIVATWSPQIKGKGFLKYAKTFNDGRFRSDVNLATALSMSADEKKDRHTALADTITRLEASIITDKTLTEVFERLERNGCEQGAPILSDNHEVYLAYASSEKRIFFLDWDGTLTNIVKNPSEAVPTEDVIRILIALTEDEKNQVWLISGRDRKFLESHFASITQLGMSAEHGCYVRDPGKDYWCDMTIDKNTEWKDEVEMVLGNLEESFANSWIERKEVAIVWHYRSADDHDACLKKAMEAKALLESEVYSGCDMEIILGKANLEARPRSLNKGSTVKDLLMKAFEQEINERFVFCAGDDTTDEDMFRAILSNIFTPQHSYTCLVSKENRPTLAQFRLLEPANVLSALYKMTSA